jgi:gas vesicle protein
MEATTMTYRNDEYGEPHEYEAGHGLSKLLTGLLIGALIGGTLMLFLAPASGKKTMARLRKKTMRLADHTRETVDDRVNDARHRFKKATSGVRKQAKSMSHRGQDLLEAQKERVAEAVAVGRSRMRMPGR